MSVFTSTLISAPAETVWTAIKNFHDMSWARGVVDSCEPVGDKAGDQVGAKRVLNGTFRETLLAIDETEKSLAYSIDDGPGTPVAKENVSGYIGKLRVIPVTDSNEALVVWTAHWEQGNNEVKPFCTNVYNHALQALKANVKA